MYIIYLHTHRHRHHRRQRSRGDSGYEVVTYGRDIYTHTKTVIYKYVKVMPPHKNGWRRSEKNAKCEPVRSRGAGQQAPPHETGAVTAASGLVRMMIYISRYFTRGCAHRKRGAEAREMK